MRKARGSTMITKVKAKANLMIIAHSANTAKIRAISQKVLRRAGVTRTLRALRRARAPHLLATLGSTTQVVVPLQMG
eukprot:5055954-Amphidinium_carterae.1